MRDLYRIYIIYLCILNILHFFQLLYIISSSTIYERMRREREQYLKI